MSERLKESAVALSGLPQYLETLWKDGETVEFYSNVLTRCMQIITEKNTPEEIEAFFTNMNANGLLYHGACDTTWNFGDTAYKCKTCQLDPTTALCISCFKAADHKGHDFSLQSVGGGFCDCGDPTAFKPSGFCEKHKEQTINVTDFDPRFITSLCHVLQFVLRKVYGFFESGKSDEYELFMDWLLKLAQRGDVVKIVVVKYISNTDIGNTALLPPSIFTPVSLLEQFYHPTQHNDVSPQIKSTFVNFCVFLRGSVEFIEAMIRTALPIYKQCILEARSHMLITSYTIFSSSSVNALLLKLDACKIVMDTISSFFNKYNIQRAQWMRRRQRIVKVRDAFSPPQFNFIIYLPTLPKPLLRLRTDIGFILSNRDIAASVVTDPARLSLWFTMVSMSQGMNPNVKYRSTMVDEWVPAFSLDISLSTTLFSMVEAITPIATHDNVERILRQASQFLGQWLLGWIANNQPVTPANTTPIAASISQVITQSTLSDGVTFHLILHRIVAAVVHLGISRLSDDFVASGGLVGIFSRIVGNNSPISTIDYARATIAHPLRLIASLGEIKAGLWRSHGREEDMFLQAVMYQSLYYQRFYDLDIFLIQVGSLLMGSNLFVEQVLSEYELADWFKLEAPSTNPAPIATATPPPKLRQSGRGVTNTPAVPTTAATTTTTTDSTTTTTDTTISKEEHKANREKKKFEDEFNKKKILAEDFIQFMIMIVTNKLLSGMTTEQIIRKELIHRLCLGDSTHSQLTRNIQKPLVNHPKFDEILNEISTFQNPQRTEQGKYSLKEACWAEFDPYFAHYNTQDLQSAEEKYNEFNNKTKSNIARGTFLSYKSLPSMQDMDQMLCSRAIHQVLFVVLQNHLVNSTKATETLLSHALQALELCVVQTANNKDSLAAKEKRTTPQKSPFVSDQLASAIDMPSATNIFVNAAHEVPVMENKRVSLLTLLIKLSTHTQVNAEHKQQLQNILNLLVENDATCKLVVENYWLAIKAKKVQSTPGKREDPEEEKKRMAKARQAAILAHMKTQQAAFKFDDADEDEDYEDDPALQKKSSVDTNSLIVDGQESTHTCALCREAGSMKRPMGRVAFIQPSSILMISKLTPEERKQRQTDAIQRDLLDIKTPGATPANPNGPNTAAGQTGIHNALNDLLGQNDMDEDIDEDMGSDDEEDSEDEVSIALSYLNKISNYHEFLDGMDEHHHTTNPALLRIFNELRGGPNATGNTTGSGRPPGDDGDDSDDDGDRPLFNTNDIIDVEDEDAMNMFGEGNPYFYDDDDDEEIGQFDETTEPVCGKPWSGKFSKQEMFRNTEQTVNLHLSFCGHQIHEACFTEYSWSLMKNVNYEGEELVDVNRGEFLCVLCRRIGNGLVPVIPDSGFTSQSQVASQSPPNNESYRLFLSSLQTALLSNLRAQESTPESLKQVRQAIEQFASRIYSVRHQTSFIHSESNEKVLPFIISSIASTIADTELAIRVDTEEPIANNAYQLFRMTDSNRVDIRSLFRVAVGHVKIYPPLEHEGRLLWNSISGCTAIPMPIPEVKEEVSIPAASAAVPLTDSTTTTTTTTTTNTTQSTEVKKPEEDISSYPPFLSLDLFHTFVQLYLRTSTQENDVKVSDRFYMMVKMLFDAYITQSIFSHFKIFDNDSTPNTDMFSSEIHRLITTQTDNQNTLTSIPVEHVRVIKSNCVVFLRKCALFLYACLNVNQMPVGEPVDSIDRETEYLLNYLKLTMPFEAQLVNIINTLITHSDNMVPLVSRWSEQIISSYMFDMSSGSATDDNNQQLAIIPSLAIPQPFLLIDLPKLYNTLSQHYSTIPYSKIAENTTRE
eukprot:gene19161-22953_t